MLVVSVFGCIDPIPPAHGYVKREKNRADIYCHIPSDETWEILCHEGEWKGDFGNCSIGK